MDEHLRSMLKAFYLAGHLRGAGFEKPDALEDFENFMGRLEPEFVAKQARLVKLV